MDMHFTVKAFQVYFAMKLFRFKYTATKFHRDKYIYTHAHVHVCTRAETNSSNISKL